MDKYNLRYALPPKDCACSTTDQLYAHAGLYLIDEGYVRVGCYTKERISHRDSRVAATSCAKGVQAALPTYPSDLFPKYIYVRISFNT
jgi:hypothetical protein